MLDIKGHYHYKITFSDVQIHKYVDIEIKHEISDECLSLEINKEDAEQIINHLKLQFDL